jgi:hypothetical protein
VCRWVVAALALVSTAHVHAFSLLGPYEDWMQPTNNLRLPGDIGGPMDITEGYRWNVPVVTYGFDQSFLDFFGSNGVAAVESAIKVLNDLPPASQIVLSNFPSICSRHNYAAEALWLVDLKSATLSALVEHLGLAQPQRNLFVVRRWDPFLTDCPYCYYEYPWPTGTIPFYIQMRNFDPVTLCPTTWLNGTLFSGEYIPLTHVAYVVAFTIDPVAPLEPAVAEGLSQFNPFGFFFTGLTYDDAGGLRFLLSRTNIFFESLAPDVRAVNPHELLVNAAFRPGIEKITFVHHHYDRVSGQPVTMRLRYWDSYIIGGAQKRQYLQRVVSQPDFLFCAGDNGPAGEWPLFCSRTGTTSWANNASLNGNPGGGGPGVIQGPVKITFQRLGPSVITQPPAWGANWVAPLAWGSFDASTNQPTVYPLSGAPPPTTLRLRFRFQITGQTSTMPPTTYVWQVPVAQGRTALLQSSTNLVNWDTLLTVTNTGTIIDWQDWGTILPQQYFRVQPQ